MLSLRLYMFQRLSALLMAPFVIGHLAVMIYAIQGGLSAAEIFGSCFTAPSWSQYPFMAPSDCVPSRSNGVV